MVTRVRIDAEGSTREEVEQHLNASFQLLYQNSVTTQFVFSGPGYVSAPYGPEPVVPRESEFVEEVYESAIRESGAIYWKGRRVIRFHDDPRHPGEQPSGDHWSSFSVKPDGTYVPGEVES